MPGRAVLPLALAACIGCSQAAVPLVIAPQRGQHDRAARSCSGDAAAAFTDAPAEVIHHEELVWLRGARGALASLDLERATLTHHFTSEVVVDVLATRAGGLWALTYDPAPEDLRVWERTPVGWTPRVQMGAPIAPVVALGERSGRPLLVGTKALFAVAEDGRVEGHLLEHPLERALGYRVATTGDGAVWVGVDRGELGGRVVRIDPDSGAVRSRRLGGGWSACAGAACAPSVSSLFVDPGASGCVVVGTAPLRARGGRLVRVCGRAMRVEEVASPALRQAMDHTLALALLHPAGSPERDRLLTAVRTALGAGFVSNVNASSLAWRGDDVLAVAPAPGGYVALGDGALFRVDARGVERIELESAEIRCGLDVVRAEGALLVGRADTQALLAATGSRRRAGPSPAKAPCEGAQIYYAWGYSEEADLADWGYAALFSCRNGAVTLLERGEPDRRVTLATSDWEELWRDLERARWRSWSGCAVRPRGDAPRERLVVADGDHVLRVDCPAKRHRAEHEAILMRIRHLAGLSASE